MNLQQKLELWHKIDKLRDVGVISMPVHMLRDYLGVLNSATGKALVRLGVKRRGRDYYV